METKLAQEVGGQLVFGWLALIIGVVPMLLFGSRFLKKGGGNTDGSPDDRS